MEVGAVSTLFTYTLQLPSSRSHESEADALGLTLDSPSDELEQSQSGALSS